MFGNTTNKKKLINVAMSKYIKPNLNAISKGLKEEYLELLASDITAIDDWTDFVIDVLSELYSEGLVFRMPDVEVLKTIAEAPTFLEKSIEISRVIGKFAGKVLFKLGLYIVASLLGYMLGVNLPIP